jgi:N-acetylmuramoyl-L-alanine amidase
MHFRYINALVVALALSTAEIELIARLLYSEARGEPLEGQFAVIECVLDRVSEGFGDSVSSVIFANGQFAKPGPLRKELVEVVRNYQDTNYQILYFRKTKSKKHWYAPYLFHIGNHAFYGYIL